jgi:hypothetical protein
MNYGEMLRKELEEESEALRDARAKFPNETWVYLLETKQFGTVDNLFESQDGVIVRVHGMGAVPIKELRKATDQEIAARS